MLPGRLGGLKSLGGFVSIGYLARSFDLINVADLDIIGQAARRCSHLIVGVFSDELCETVFGRLPVIPLVERVELVRHVRGVGDVVVHHSHDIQPDAGVVVFAVAGSPSGCRVAGSVLLTPTRHSASPVLRNALRGLLDADREEVA